MNELINKINELRKSEVKKEVDRRIEYFRAINKKSSKEWFSELCFCLLTANTSAEMGIRVQKKLGYEGFTDYKSKRELIRRLKNVSCRFYNRRGHFIHLANDFRDIKNILENQDDKRKWLVENIKGLGYKEASHFLRNVGLFDYAIIDKHILRLLHENKMIEKIPDSVNKKCYLDYEKILEKLSEKVNLSQGELDLYLWYMKTGKVLK